MCKKIAFIHSVGWRNTPDQFNARLSDNKDKMSDLFYYDVGRACNRQENYQITPVCKIIVNIFKSNKSQFATNWFNLKHQCN